MALDVSICLPYTAVRIAALRTAVSLPGDLALKPLPQNAVSDLQRPQILCIGDTKVKLEPIRPPPEQASVDHGLWVRPCPDKVVIGASRRDNCTLRKSPTGSR